MCRGGARRRRLHGSAGRNAQFHSDSVPDHDRLPDDQPVRLADAERLGIHSAGSFVDAVSLTDRALGEARG